MAADQVAFINRKPLLIFWDCEAAQSNIFTGDIIEVAARCNPEVRDASFDSLISSSQELAKFTVEKCGIKPADLEGKLPFSDVFRKFLKWLQKTVRKANQKTGHKYFPVLCAHGGYGFDFTMLLSNMKRHKIDESILKKNNLHFADSFEFCKQLQEDHVEELCETRLSMDALFSKFCPEKQFLNRHRAMGDVNAMVEIFSTPPLKTAIKKIGYVTSESLCSWFKTQYSAKEQKILLEEKMAKLDAYTKTVNLKKFVQIQLNYEAIQRIFENCCSFMDFYEAMKEIGVDRKTAKYFACQFGGLGLKNQGTEPYCSLPKPEVIDDGGLDFSLNDVDVLAKEEFERAVNVPPLPECEFTIPESSESWDCDLDESRSFTFTVAKPEVPLSLTVDDFVSDLPSKRSKNSKKNGTNERYENHMKVDTKFEKRSKASMKKQVVDDVFRNGTASLQLGNFPNQKERFELEKELLAQMNKAMQSEERSEKNQEQGEKGVEEASVDSIPRTGGVIGNDSSINSDFLGNEEKLNNKKTSEKDQTNYSNPRTGEVIGNDSSINSDFLGNEEKLNGKKTSGKDQINSSNPRTGEIIGNDSINSDFLGNGEKLNGKKTLEKDQTNSSNPRTGEIIGNNSINSDFLGNEEKLNGKKTLGKDQANYKKPKRKFKGRNKRKAKSSQDTQSALGSVNTTVTIMKRHVTSPSKENSKHTTSSSRENSKHTTSISKENSEDTISSLEKSSFEKAELKKSSQDGSTLHDSARGESSESVVDSIARQLPQTADRSSDNSQEELKESKPTNQSAHELVTDSLESTRNVLNVLSLPSAGQNRESAVENAPRSEHNRKKNVLNVPSKNARMSEHNTSTKQDVVNGNLSCNQKMICSDLKTSVEQNSQSVDREQKQRSTSDSKNCFNNSFVSQQPATKENAAGKEVSSELGKKNASDGKLLQGDEQVRRKARVTQYGNNAKKESTKLCQEKSRQSLQKKAKLKKDRLRHEAVVFVKKSREKKMKNWPQVEIHIGDIPIYVPVEPDLLNIGVSANVLQQEDRSEEKPVEKTESKNVLGCNSITGNERTVLGNINLQQDDLTVQIKNSVELVSCVGDESSLSGDVNMREHITEHLHEGQNGLLQTQKDHFVDNTRTIGGKEDSQEVGIRQSSVGSSNHDQVKNAPDKRQCDVIIMKNEKAESIVSDVLQRPLISGDSKVVASSSVKSHTSVAEVERLEGAPSFDEYSNNLFQGSDELAVSMNATVKKTDTWQQTDSYHAQHEDQEQQTDCALYTTFNNINGAFSDSRAQDKELPTEDSVSYPQTSDTFSLDGDNVSDSYETFPSTIESSSPPRSPATRNDFYLYDTGPCDINTTVYSAGDTGYESPGGVFNISMSPRPEERYPDENTLYPEENTQYLDKNTRYPEEDTLYPEDAQYSEKHTQYNRSSITLPEYKRYYYNRRFLSQNNSSQTPFLHQPNVYFNTSSHPNVIPQRFLTHSCTPLPPHYPINPNHVPAPHLYQPRFPTQYIPRYSQSTSNVPPHQYHSLFKY